MEIINRQNPWWFFEEWEEKDRDIRKWNEMKIKWYPKWVDEVSIESFSLNFVYGPRQVGKTTGIKLLIKRLIEKGENPQSIFYFNLEGIASLREFRKILLWYIEKRKREKIDSSYIFLDEVTSVREWYRMLKFFIDQGYFDNDVITVTGSSSVGILKVSERFPGRRGKGRDVVVLPLSFPEFVEVHGYNKRKLLYNYEDLLMLWEKYKKVGGFPASINEVETAMDDIISGIVSEIQKHNRSLEISQIILSSLLEKIPSALSYNSIASDIGISHKTVREYLEFFKDCFIVGIAYWKHGKEVNFKREKKIFFRDPFLLKVISNWTFTEFNESAIYENVVQEHLYRKFGEIYYYKNSHEIDCIAGGLKVEVKAGKPHRKYPKNVIILKEEDIPRFLIELFEDRNVLKSSSL